MNPLVPPIKPSQAYAHFSTPERGWLNVVPSQIRRNAASKCIEALNASFRGLRKSPTFKNRFSKKNCLVTNELFNVKVT